MVDRGPESKPNGVFKLGRKAYQLGLNHGNSPLGRNEGVPVGCGVSSGDDLPQTKYDWSGRRVY